MQTRDSIDVVVNTAILAVFAVIAALAGGVVYMDKLMCDARAQSFAHSWGPIQGCLIEWEGIKIPIENFGIMPDGRLAP